MERMITNNMDLSQFSSRVRVWCPENPDHVVEGKNLITYQGADIVARLLAGRPEYRIARMWFEYDNAGGSLGLSPGRGDTAASVAALAVGDRDIVRADLVAEPALSSSDPAKYQVNRGTYHAITAAGAVGEKQGLGFGSGSGSEVLAMCLVASPAGLRPSTMTSSTLDSSSPRQSQSAPLVRSRLPG